MPLPPFQSTHPHGCDTLASRANKKDCKFQSTHPHGCDQQLRRTSINVEISIHAPSRVRLGNIIFPTFAVKFQSTHPHGCDSIKTKYFNFQSDTTYIANLPYQIKESFYFDVGKLQTSHYSLSANLSHNPCVIDLRIML